MGEMKSSVQLPNGTEERLIESKRTGASLLQSKLELSLNSPLFYITLFLLWRI